MLNHRDCQKREVRDRCRNRLGELMLSARKIFDDVVSPRNLPTLTYAVSWAAPGEPGAAQAFPPGHGPTPAVDAD